MGKGGGAGSRIHIATHHAFQRKKGAKGAGHGDQATCDDGHTKPRRGLLSRFQHIGQTKGCSGEDKERREEHQRSKKVPVGVAVRHHRHGSAQGYGALCIGIRTQRYTLPSHIEAVEVGIEIRLTRLVGKIKTFAFGQYDQRRKIGCLKQGLVDRLAVEDAFELGV